MYTGKGVSGSIRIHRVYVLIAVICGPLLVSCTAMREMREDMDRYNDQMAAVDSKLESVHQKLQDNRIERLEIQDRLRTLADGGKDRTEEAGALRERLVSLGEQYGSISIQYEDIKKRIAGMDKRTSDNTDGIEKLKTDEAKRSNVVKEFQKQLMQIEADTDKVLEDLGEDDRVSDEE